MFYKISSKFSKGTKKHVLAVNAVKKQDKLHPPFNFDLVLSYNLDFDLVWANFDLLWK